MVFIGYPPLIRPQADVVHVSVTFTWDLRLGRELAQAWAQYYPVEIGGPAFGSPVNEFTPGMYIKTGVTFTSRGCPCRCVYCLVPKREGKLLLYPDFAPGHIIQDNNILATGREHMSRVFNMLRQQSQAAIFSGGLATDLVDDWVVDKFRALRIKSAFFACDTDAELPALERARQKLIFLNLNKLYCYALLGFNGESLEAGIARCREVFKIGMLPFAQLYQPPDKRIDYPIEWKQAARLYSRPAATKAICRAQGKPPGG